MRSYLIKCTCLGKWNLSILYNGEPINWFFILKTKSAIVCYINQLSFNLKGN